MCNANIVTKPFTKHFHNIIKESIIFVPINVSLFLSENKYLSLENVKYAVLHFMCQRSQNSDSAQLNAKANGNEETLALRIQSFKETMCNVRTVGKDILSAKRY